MLVFLTASHAVDARSAEPRSLRLSLPPITPHVLWGETGDFDRPCRLVGKGTGRGAHSPRKPCSTWNNASDNVWHNPFVPEPFVATRLRASVAHSRIDNRQSPRGVPRSCRCRFTL